MNNTLEKKITRVVESHVGYLELKNKQLENENYKLRLMLEQVLTQLQHMSVSVDNLLYSTQDTKSITHTHQENI